MRTRKRCSSSVAKSQVSSNWQYVVKSQKKKKIASRVSSYARIVATDSYKRTVNKLGRILVQLHGHGLSANEITLFGRYLERNRLMGRLFLITKGDQEKINFIRELNLDPYKV